jgi:hypothetical protein
MLQKPECVELVIYEDVAGFVGLAVASARADKWVKDNAEEFGKLVYSSMDKEYHLWLYRNYEREQVMDYLQSAWDAFRWEGEVSDAQD